MKKVKKHKSAKAHEQTWADGDRTYLVGAKRGRIVDRAITVSVSAREVDADGNQAMLGGEPVEFTEMLTLQKSGLPEDVSGHMDIVLNDAMQRALREIAARRRALEAWELIPEGDE